MHYKERENREYIYFNNSKRGNVPMEKKGSDILPLKVRLNDAKKVHC